MPFFTSTIGVIKHAALWLTSGCSDSAYKNAQDAKQKDEMINTDDDVAIYCIHGTCDRSSAFSLIADRIKTGLVPQVKSTHLIAFDGRAQLNGIDFYAQQLVQKIKANKHKRVILMGHSRGAIVSSYFAEYLAKQNDIKVELVISICGPFRGTNWAFFPLTASASVDQMRVGSAFLKDLTDKMKTSGNKYYYFTASDDYLVKPEQTYLQEHKDNVIELDNHGHLSIMWSQRIVERIKNIINSNLTKKPESAPMAEVVAEVSRSLAI